MKSDRTVDVKPRRVAAVAFVQKVETTFSSNNLDDHAASRFIA